MILKPIAPSVSGSWRTIAASFSTRVRMNARVSVRRCKWRAFRPRKTVIVETILVSYRHYIRKTITARLNQRTPLQLRKSEPLMITPLLARARSQETPNPRGDDTGKSGEGTVTSGSLCTCTCVSRTHSARRSLCYAVGLFAHSELSHTQRRVSPCLSHLLPYHRLRAPAGPRGGAPEPVPPPSHPSLSLFLPPVRPTVPPRPSASFLRPLGAAG